MIDLIREPLLQFGLAGDLAWMLLKILVIMLPLIVSVAFYTLFEHKVIGWMHVRQGPQYVGGVFGIG
ncbi:MAG: NADH-quinone oxidoreductase subunit H, partial [Arenimonas sp.]